MRIPNQLVESLNNRQCVVLVGSGLSSRLFTRIGKRYPSWTGLLEELLDYAYQHDCFNENEKIMLMDMLSKGNLSMSAQILRNRMTETDFGAFLDSIFRNDNRFDRAHNQIMGLPFAFFMTTNYDTILECAHSYKYNTQLPVYTNEQSATINNKISNNERFLYKIHGTFDRPSTVVLTKNDYRKLYYEESYIATMKNIFINYSVLFIGFSYSDPDIELILSEISRTFSGNNRMHYLLISQGVYNSLEQEYMKNDDRVTVMEYDNSDGSHSGVDLFLDELISRVKKKLNIT